MSVEGEPRGRNLRMGAVLGKKTLLLTAKMSMLYAAVQLFNHLFWPDEEEELGEVGRRQLHLILGRQADGTVLSLRFQGALSDALSWFNLHDFPEDVREHLFTPFFTSKENGQGIGLTMVQEILLGHGFDFSLESAGNGHTHFTILF